MHDELGRKHGNLFRNVIESTLRANKQGRQAAARGLSPTFGIRAQNTRNGRVNPHGGRTSGAGRPEAFSSKILLWNGQAILCTLRERSNVGARLTVETQVHIPPVFTLEIAPGREQLPARLAWRKQDEIGVVFLEVV